MILNGVRQVFDNVFLRQFVIVCSRLDLFLDSLIHHAIVNWRCVKVPEASLGLSHHALLIRDLRFCVVLFASSRLSRSIVQAALRDGEQPDSLLLQPLRARVFIIICVVAE